MLCIRLICLFRDIGIRSVLKQNWHSLQQFGHNGYCTIAIVNPPFTIAKAYNFIYPINILDELELDEEQEQQEQLELDDEELEKATML